MTIIRILHAIRQGKIGGGESHVIDLVESLDKEIFESVVLSFTEGPMVDKMKAMGVVTHVVHTERPFDFTKWRLVKQILKEERIDIVHAHGTRAMSNTFSSAKRLKIPIIYTVHGWSFHPDQHNVLKTFRIKSEQFLVNKSDITICVSVNNFDDASRLFSMAKAQVIKLGINLNKFNANAPLSGIREEFGISSDTVLVGYIVRMTVQKDPMTLVKAISLIPKHLNVKFLLVGDGDLKEAVIKQIHEMQLDSNVIMTGFRDDVPSILQAIDIYCLPSLWEGLPLGVLEAMAMGKAVVATAVDGVKEVITDKNNGLLVPVKSPDKLAEAIGLLAADAEIRKSLGMNAQQTVVENFSKKGMVSSIERVYQKVLHHP